MMHRQERDALAAAEAVAAEEAHAEQERNTDSVRPRDYLRYNATIDLTQQHKPERIHPPTQQTGNDRGRNHGPEM